MTFDDLPEGPFEPGEGYRIEATRIVGRPPLGNVWEVVPNPDGPGKVLHKRPEGNLDYYCFLLSSKPVLNAEVRCRAKVVGGQATPYVGLVARWRNVTDFYVLRYRPKTNNIELQRTIDLVREPVKKLERIPPNTMNMWKTLAMRIEGTKVSCYLDGELLYEPVDAAFLTPGRVGVWASGDADVYFDDLVIRDLSPGAEALEPPTLAEGWSVETIDPGPDSGRESCLVVDESGAFHVAYWDRASHQLKYATRGRGEEKWTVEVVAEGGKQIPEEMIVGVHPRLAVGTDRQPRIVYTGYRFEGCAVGFAERTREGWKHTSFDRESQADGWIPSLALDSRNRPHILYEDIRHYLVKYATRRDDGSWEIRKVEQAEVMAKNAPIYTSIEVDSRDSPHLLYNVLAINALRYVTWDGRQWIRETIEAAGQPFTIGPHSHLALAPDGTPHVVHNEPAFGEIKYAVKTASGKWDNRKIFGGQAVSDPFQERPPYSVGTFAKVALDRHQVPHIMFYNANKGTLEIIRPRGDGWDRVDTGIHGWNLWLEVGIDAQGRERPYATFCDGRDGSLKLATGPPIE